MFARSDSDDGRTRTGRRFIRPESIAIRWVVVLATVIGGLAAAIPLGQAAIGWWPERTEESSTMAGGTVDQGSPAADALVRQLFDSTDGRRLELDAILTATPGQANGKATNGLTVFYHCGDGPGEPGADRCNQAELYWQSNPLPVPVRDGVGWHLVGTYSVVLDPSKGQVYDATTVVFLLTSVTG
jgi:hypothetical protein